MIIQKRGFASDNNSGIHPLLLEAIGKANSGHVVSYGDDPFTASAIKVIKKHFGPNASDVFFVLTGTGANVLSLSSVTRPYNAVICADTAHIQSDECGAPEKFTDCKLIAIPTSDGKLKPEQVRPRLQGFGFEHHVQIKVISISQPTEMGTVYSVNEIKALSDLAREYNLYLHMDGARLANAAVHLNSGFREFTADAGVDILSFGGTKNGMLFGESVIFFRPGISDDFKYLRKQSMQLVSKMRFISAQFESYLNNKLWYINALHANKMAQLLLKKVSVLPGVQITQKVEANALFAIIPHEIIEPLQKKYFFYVWDEVRNEVRWMTSFDTTPEDIEGFAESLRSLLC
ncbi:MAG TPA: low specificity L-threonine aldolase [Bacteroidales bacterium]|jgi:threonine aldolase|nr:low specificity L-threonine aldolase [Bacteroidales bacterium]